ncbi:MAG: ATP-binding protein [Acidimicrobiales bacterium]
MARARQRGTRLQAADFLTPARPPVAMIAVLMFSAALVVTFIAPNMDHHHETSSQFAIWLLGNMAGAATITLFVAFVSSRIPAELLARRATGMLTLGLLFTVGGFAAGLQRAHIDAWIEGHQSYPMAWPSVFGYTTMVVFLGLVGNGLVGLRARLDQRNASLLERVAELQRARRLLVVSDEQFRRDIAEELHGRVQTRLVAAELMLDQVRSLLDEGSPEARIVLAHALNVIGEVRDRDVRALSHRLHPSTIRVVLLPALRALLAGFEETFAIRTSLTVDAQVARLDDPSDRRLHESVALVVYRAVEEALANSQRHGRATEVDVALQVRDDGCLHVTISDNGIGLPKSGRLAPGLGLTSMEGRVEQRGGTCTIADRDSSGVVVTVVVPLRSVDLGHPAAAALNGHRRRSGDQESLRVPALSPAGRATPRRYGRGPRAATVLSK